MKVGLPLATVALFFAGCGGGGAPSAPPKTVSAPPPTTSLPSGATVSGAKRGETKKPKAEPAPPPIPRGALFVGGNQPNFTVVSYSEARPEDRFVIQSPPIGLDSTFVSIELPPPASPPAAVAELREGFTPAVSTEYSDDGWPLRIRSDKDAAEMAFVAAGPFLQGIDGGDPNAGPRHAIELDAYYIDTHEVTVGQFQKYREALKADKKPAPAPIANATAPPDHPALGVPWKDAMQYAKWAGKELPTEAEWEKAARGSQGYSYPWGYGRPVWERRRAFGQIDPVGSFRTDQSPYGVLDVAGNAREWCQDWYAEDAYQQFASTAGVAIKNWPGPRSADKQSRRVVRGGASRWEVWARNGVPMKDAPPDVGFRCVLRINPGAVQEAVAADSEPADPQAPPKGGTPKGGVPERGSRKKAADKSAGPSPGF